MPAPNRIVAAQILPTRLFRREFLQCVRLNPSSIRVVSPFIGKIPPFGNIVDFSRSVLQHENCTFQLVTRPPGKENGTITPIQAEAIVRLGVDLLIRVSPCLHSKIYHFEFREGNQAAFVGSANFTHGGFDRNDETMAIMRDSTDNRRVNGELERISGRGSVPYPIWKAWSEEKMRRLPHV